MNFVPFLNLRHVYDNKVLQCKNPKWETSFRFTKNQNYLCRSNQNQQIDYHHSRILYDLTWNMKTTEQLA